MKRILAGMLLATVAFTGTSYGDAQGCVTDYFLAGNDTEAGDPYFTLHPNLDVTVHTSEVVETVNATPGYVNAWVVHLNGFVNCVV